MEVPVEGYFENPSLRENCANTEFFLLRIRTRKNSALRYFSHTDSFQYVRQFPEEISPFFEKNQNRDNLRLLNIEFFLQSLPVLLNIV